MIESVFEEIKFYFDNSSFFSKCNPMPDHYEYGIPTMSHWSILLSENGIAICHGYWEVSMEEFLNNPIVPDELKLFLYFNIDLWRKRSKLSAYSGF